MRAIVITAAGGPEVLEERDVPAPRPAPDRILVRVHATALNRADVLQRRGHYPAPPGAPADIPGLEIAGVVEEIGAEVREWRVGDRVMGLVAGGGHAELAVLHEREAMPIPESLSFEEAAAVPESFITAHDALFTRAHLRSGERVLIHAVGSGVGVAALQLALAAGARPIGISRTAWKLDRARELGLQAGIVGDASTFAEAVARETGDAGVQVVLDLVGGAWFPGNVASLATLGRLVLVGLVAGRTAEADLGTVLRKRLTIVGTALRSRALEEKIEAARRVRAEVLPLLASGAVKSVVDREFGFAEVRAAHEYMESNSNFGKIVLRP